MDAISNSVIIPVTKPRFIVVLVSTSITLLRFKCPQLASYSPLLLLINKYSNSIVNVTNLYLYVTVISQSSL